MPFTDAQFDRLREASSEQPDYRTLSAKITRARVHHNLDCGCTILPGFYYCKVAVLIEGKFFVGKTHAGYDCPKHFH